MRKIENADQRISPEAKKRMAYDLFGVEPEPEKYQLFAKIRPESKYADQQRDEKPFDIVIYPERGEYCIYGNQNAYRPTDLEIYVSADGKLIRLS